MKKKNGFIAISVIFSFFIVFLMLITLNITKHEQNRILLEQIKEDMKPTVELKSTGELTEEEIPISED